MSEAKPVRQPGPTNAKPTHGLTKSALLIGATVLLASVWTVLVFWTNLPIASDRFVEGLAVIVAGLAAGLAYLANAMNIEEHRILQLMRDENQQSFEISRDLRSARRDARTFIGQHIGTINGHLGEIVGRMAAVGLEFDTSGTLRTIDREDKADDGVAAATQGTQMPLIRVPADLKSIVR